jgi:hypothetical protein
MREGLATVGEHPHRFELAVDLQHPQAGRADRDDCDRVRVAGIGLVVVTSVDESDPRGELGGHVHEVLAGLERALREGSTGTIGAFYRPDPLRPGVGVAVHRGVASLVGGEAARPEQPLVAVDDLDRGRQLVGSTPMTI